MTTAETLIPLRRSDLMARPVNGDSRYRIEDVMRGEAFAIGEQEHFLLTRCDGRTPLAEVCRDYAQRFEQPLSEAELDEFLRMAHGAGLLTSNPDRWRDAEATWWNMSPAEATAGRDAAVEQTAPGKLKTYRRFLWEYDRHSHPLLIDDNPDIPDDEKPRRKYFVAHVFPVLAPRILERARLYGLGGSPGFGDLPTPEDERAVPYLSTFQLDLIRRCLPAADGGIDYGAFGEAFEMFANGELRVDDPHMPGPSESNNGNNFSFAEFGFLAIESGIDVEEWARLLNPLVRMQQIFTTVYRPDGPGPYGFCDYASANWSPDKQVDEAFKQRLRAEHAGLSVVELERRAARNAHAAFGAGWRRPTGKVWSSD